MQNLRRGRRPALTERTSGEQGATRAGGGPRSWYPWRIMPKESGVLRDRSDSRGPSAALYYVYIVRCADATLYTGCTNDVEARVRTHNQGRGAKYTAGRRPVRLAYAETCESRSAAQRREAEIKRWSRAEKKALIKGNKVSPIAPPPSPISHSR
jgi:putative endonuclease